MMGSNPVLHELGFSDQDRVVIIHADDMGMCQATVQAYADLLDFGLISSAATMVPCPWFPSIAAFCRQHPDLDMGVHLTTTCEYRGYRWGPISSVGFSSGMLDGEGYLHDGPVGAQRMGDALAVQQEIHAQVRRALDAGIDVTHVDSHQFSMIHEKFLTGFAAMAYRYCLPPALLRLDREGWARLTQALGLPLDPASAKMAARTSADLECRGVPLLDHATMLPLDRPEDRVAQAIHAFDSLPPGLTHFVIHPAVDTPELRAIAPDWPGRVADYQAFLSEELRAHIRRAGFQVIGYRPLRDLMRQRCLEGR